MSIEPTFKLIHFEMDQCAQLPMKQCVTLWAHFWGVRCMKTLQNHLQLLSYHEMLLLL